MFSRQRHIPLIISLFPCIFLAATSTNVWRLSLSVVLVVPFFVVHFTVHSFVYSQREILHCASSRTSYAVDSLDFGRHSNTHRNLVRIVSWISHGQSDAPSTRRQIAQVKQLLSWKFAYRMNLNEAKRSIKLWNNSFDFRGTLFVLFLFIWRLNRIWTFCVGNHNSIRQISLPVSVGFRSWSMKIIQLLVVSVSLVICQVWFFLSSIL